MMNTARRAVKYLVTLFALVALTQQANAQINLTITMRSPYSPVLSDYRSDPSRVLVMMTNLTGNSYNVRISGYAQNSSGDVRVETRDDRSVPVIRLGPNETRTLTGRDLSLFDPAAVRFTGTDATTVQRTGRLPEGSYEVCIRALNYDNISEVLSGPLPACTNFNIVYVDPPRLTQPTCESIIETTSPQLVNFMWTQTSPVIPLTDYLFTIVEVPEGRDPYEAFRTRTSPPFFERRLSNQTSFTYSVTEPAMRLGRTYAWRVKAIDPTSQSMIRNNGESEVCTFTFGRSTSGGGGSALTSLDAVYPVNGDVIPWLPPHLVVRFNDYSDEITQMDYTLTVRGSDGSTHTSARVLNWPNGPRRDQGWPDASYNDRSRYIIVNQDDATGGPVPSPWGSNLRRGITYTWSVVARFRFQGRTVSLTSPERTFSIGATTPENVAPVNAARIAPEDQPITLEWRNPRPIELNPPDLIGMRGRSSSMFFGITTERWRLELSRDSTFARTDTSVTGNIAEYATGEAATDLYATRSMQIGRRDTGTYFWRASWLRPDGSVYSQGGPWSFYIGNAPAPTPTDTSRRISGACRDDCSSPAITNTTVATRSFAVGDVVNVGRFSLRLTRVTGSASSLSGEGTVQVPFLRAPIMVEFSGIRVNTDNTMFDGRLTAKIATESPVSADVANALSGLGITNDQASTLSTFVSQSSRLVSAFAGSTPVSLPIGFNNLVEGEQFVVGIMGMVFTPTQAKLNAAMSFPMPDLGPGVGLGLGARDICFHPGGLGGNGEATLYLVSDLGYREPDTWGFVFKAQSSTDSGTYVSFDCNGFKELRLSAQCEFPRTWLIPQPDDGSSLAKALFKTTIRRNGDWIAAASLDRCEIVGAPGFIMEAREIAYDHSNVRNPTGITFPTGFTGDRTSAWQGFYIGRASISLPPELRTFDESRPPQMAVTNLMIGSGGFTASFRAENVIQYPQGNFGEWGASLDTIAVDIVSNSLRSGSLMGSIKIPISDSGIYYRCTLGRPTTGSGLAYEFVVQPRDTISAQIWEARMYLAPTSRIELGNMSGSFRASANLTGGITISGDVGGISDLGFRGISFQNFRVQSTAPYVNAGTWAFASENHSMAGFPVSISGLNVVAGSRRSRPAAGIQFTISVNLQPGSNAISGGTTLSLWGRLAEGSGGGGQSFEFDGVQLDSIGVRADMGAVQIAGALNIYNEHATFGNGFRGAIEANFLRQVIVAATVQFGEVRGFRYWYVDANATFSAAIPIFTGVGIYGFGGGAWYHMRREGIEPPTPNVSTASNTADTSRAPGRTNSGFQFIPDNGQEFGFRAKVVLGTMPSSEGFNADVAFGMTFLPSGGVGDIFIEGAGYMMASVTNRAEAKVTATVNINYNFPTQVFHGIFSVAINASPFTGGGTMVIHAEPRTWYIKIGEPTPVDRRVNLNLGTWLRVDAYVMAGMDLPGPPPLPPEITRVLGPLPVVRHPAMSRGDGFAMGASASINTGRQQFLIFYGQAALTLGFDLSLLRYGPDASCEGIPGRIGVNGWYAQGQLYAYVQASIGLYVDLMFTSGEFEILGIAAAAAIQAGFPNPAWAIAAVGGEYRILGGAISGRCNFNFKMGEECIPVTDNPLAQIDIITDMQPRNGAENVDVFVEPQVTFGLPVDQAFELTEIDGRGQERVRTFRVKIRDYSLRVAGSGARVSGSYSFNYERTLLTFATNDALLSRERYRQYVAAYGEEYIGARWLTATRRDGSSIDQTEEATFTTGDAPDNIPARNVAYSYPLDRQRYFLKGECPTGEVSLKRGQPYLFAQLPNKRVTVKARFIPTLGAPAGGTSDGVLESTVRYNESSRTLVYDMPPLLNNLSYAVQFVRKEESNRPAENPLLSQLAESLRDNPLYMMMPLRTLYSRSGSNVQQNQRVLPGERARAGEKNLYYYFFKSSQYNTMRDKLAAMTPLPTQRLTPLGNFEIIRAKFTKAEGLDIYDIDGFAFTNAGRDYRVGPLIRVDAATRTMQWHRNFTEPFVYSAIERIRRTYTYALVSEWNRYNQASHLNFAQWFTRGEQPMTDAEMLPPRFSGFTLASFGSGLLGYGGGMSLLGGGGLGMGMSSAGVLAEVPSVKVDFHQGIVVPWDWQRVRDRAAYLYSFYCCEFGTPEDFAFLRSIMNKRYVMLTRGNYRLDFTYGWCQSPDDSRSVAKEFTY